MGRNNTQAMTNIRMLCRVQHLDERALYARSKLILSIYRDVCWSAVGRANDIESDLMETCGSALDSALIYLETFAPDETREQFEERVQSLFETRWIIDLIENTMVRIRDYPVQMSPDKSKRCPMQSHRFPSDPTQDHSLGQLRTSRHHGR